MVGPRFDVERFRMRGYAANSGDLVEAHTREINGKRYDFSRVTWGNGEVSVVVRPYGKTTELHRWEGHIDQL